MTGSLQKEFSQNKKPLLFILKMLGLFLMMYCIYEFIIIKYTNIDGYLIEVIIRQAGYLLELSGYKLLDPNPLYTSHIGIEGTSGVIVGNTCDGLSLFILFACFVFIFKGKLWFKLLYSVLGILIIHFFNVIRVYALALIVKYSPESLEFHHSYTFTLFIYTVIFILWILKVKLYSKYKI